MCPASLARVSIITVAGPASSLPWEALVQAFRADQVREVRLGMALDVAFHRVPLTVLVPNLLTARTDWQDPPQDFDLLQGLLQLLFPGLAAVHFPFELQPRIQPGQQPQAVDRLGDVVHSPRGKRWLQECPRPYPRHPKGG